MQHNIKSLALLSSLLSCVLVGQVCAAELKVIDKIKVPGAGLESFDISYMDQKNNRYYLADRTNNALDVVDAKTGKFIAQIPGFVGIGKHDVAIPVNQIREEKDRFVLPGASKEALKALPEFQYAKNDKSKRG